MTDVPPTLTRRSVLAGVAAVTATAALPAPASAAAGNRWHRAAKTIARYPVGEFLESVAVGPDGAVYLTASLAARVDRVAPDGTVRTYAQFPAVPGAIFPPQGPSALTATLAFGPDRALYATYLHSERPDRSGVYRVTPAGHRLVAAFPEGGSPNGITADARGGLFLADSATGTVWRLRPGTSVFRRWIQDPSLAPTGVPQFPGANGVKFFAGSLYVSNSSTAQIVRVPVRPDGTAGRPVVHAREVAVDDFAFDRQGGIFGTTHPFDTVVRIDPSGTVTTVAGAGEGIVGPTAAAFGTRRGDRRSLYVVTDGGLFGSLLDPGLVVGQPRLVRLDAGVRGLPLPGTTAREDRR